MLTPFDKTCITTVLPVFFKNEGSPNGATVAMATYMIKINLFQKDFVAWILLHY